MTQTKFIGSPVEYTGPLARLKGKRGLVLANDACHAIVDFHDGYGPTKCAQVNLKLIRS